MPDYREKLLKDAYEALSQVCDVADRINDTLLVLRLELHGYDSWADAEEEARSRTVADGLPWGVTRNERGKPIVRLADPEDPEDISLD